MTDKNLIDGIKALKEIKPREDWVILTKENIFKEEKAIRPGFISIIKRTLDEFQKGERFVFNHKPAFAFALMTFVIVGVFGFAQGSVPGESLFTLKKITEKGQAALVSDKNKARYELEMVGKRLDDLAKIAQTNSGKNLGPAINEYRQTASNAAKSLAGTNDIKSISAEVKKIEEKKQEIQSLGVTLENNIELDDAVINMVEREIDFLDGKQLTETENQLLSEAKAFYQEGRYSEALEKLIQIGQ